MNEIKSPEHALEQQSEKTPEKIRAEKTADSRAESGLECGFSTNNVENSEQRKASESYPRKDVDALDEKHEKSLDEKGIENTPEKINCRNEDLVGRNHPETGVPFEKRQIELDGRKCEVVVPKFESVYEAKLPESKFKSPDREQFKECNSQLKNEISSNANLRGKFNSEELALIQMKRTPDGYTWHHDAEAGKMQLVDQDKHQKTGHTGGRNFWGGGADNR